MAALNLVPLSKTLNPNSQFQNFPKTPKFPLITLNPNSQFQNFLKTPKFLLSLSYPLLTTSRSSIPPAKSSRFRVVRAISDGEYSSKRSSSSYERETSIMIPGRDYYHWFIVMKFPKDPAPAREQMIDTYLNTLATVLGSMEEAKENMYAFSTTAYTGFQCTVSEETSEKFKGLPGVLWVLPDSYIDAKNKDYGGDQYINGEIIPWQYPTTNQSSRNRTRSKSKVYLV